MKNTPTPSTKPLLLDIPSRLETDRLILQCPQPGQGEALNACVRETFDQLNQWMPWAREMPSVTDSEEYLRTSSADFLTREWLPLLIHRKDTGAIIGSSGYNNVNWAVPSCEIGYWLTKSAQGQGFATEATEALTSFAFDTLGMARITILVDTRNEASSKVAERCGYHLEGINKFVDRDNQGNLSSNKVYSRYHPGLET